MRLTAAENKAIEQRAVEVTRAYFDGLEYETKDVGSTESYDIKATKDGQTIKIEVKGTTSDGSDVVLTSNEVELHESEHPYNRSRSSGTSPSKGTATNPPPPAATWSCRCLAS